jgi:hypothetical protein
MVDSLRAYEILKTAELPEPQARAILSAIGSVVEDNNLQQVKDLAAKGDLVKFEAKTSAMETSLKQEILRVEGVLRQDTSRLESKLERMIIETKAELEIKIADLKSELLRWMFVFWVGQVAATIAIIFSTVRLLK